MAEIAGADTTLEVPTEIHGFAVEIAVGPYPVGHRRSHRRAVIATLRPLTPELAAKLARAGQAAIIGAAPVDDDTARKLQLDEHDPGRLTSEEEEQLAIAALRPAAKLAKQVADAPT